MQARLILAPKCRISNTMPALSLTYALCPTAGCRLSCPNLDRIQTGGLRLQLLASEQVRRGPPCYSSTLALLDLKDQTTCDLFPATAGRRRAALCLLLLGWFAAGTCLRAQHRARMEFTHQAGDVVITADRIFSNPENVWGAEGRVVVEYPGAILQASHVTYEPLSGQATAEGEVSFSRGVEWLRGSRAEFNLKTDRGVLYDAEGFTERELFVRAKELFKTGKDTYLACRGTLTSCSHEVPTWSFKIREAKIKQGGWAHLSGTLFRVKNVPILYLPRILLPTERKKRSSGFLPPLLGNSNSKGRSASLPFYLVLGRSADLTVTHHYFSRRGFGQTALFRARPNPQSSLVLESFWVNDRVGQGGTAVKGKGQAVFSEDFRAAFDFDLVTSFDFRQAFSDDFFTATRPVENSRFFLTKNSAGKSFNLLFSREKTAFPGPDVVTRSTPSVSFNLTGRRILDSLLLMDLKASADTLHRSDSRIRTSGATERVDLFSEFYTSVPLFQGLRLSPRIGLRDTFYSDSFAFIAKDSLSDEGLHRRYFEFNLSLQGWGLAKVYRSGSLPAYKHLIEPFFRYHYITGIDDFDRVIRFDSLDTVTNTQEIEYGLFNRVFVKRSAAREEVHEWLSLKVAQKYFFDPNFGGAFTRGALNQFASLNDLTGFPFGAAERSFSPLILAARITPDPGVSFDARADYDPKADRFRNLSASGFLSRDGFYLSSTYFLTKALEEGTFDANQLQAQFALGDFKQGFSFSNVFSYDAERSQFLNYKNRVNYFSDCCGISVEFQGFDIGSRSETGIRFTFFLKGLGNFGNIDRPNSIF